MHSSLITITEIRFFCKSFRFNNLIDANWRILLWEILFQLKYGGQGGQINSIGRDHQHRGESHVGLHLRHQVRGRNMSLIVLRKISHFYYRSVSPLIVNIIAALVSKFFSIHFLFWGNSVFLRGKIGQQLHITSGSFCFRRDFSNALNKRLCLSGSTGSICFSWY